MPRPAPGHRLVAVLEPEGAHAVGIARRRLHGLCIEPARVRIVLAPDGVETESTRACVEGREAELSEQNRLLRFGHQPVQQGIGKGGGVAVVADHVAIGGDQPPVLLVLPPSGHDPETEVEVVRI